MARRGNRTEMKNYALINIITIFMFLKLQERNMKNVIVLIISLMHAKRLLSM